MHDNSRYRTRDRELKNASTLKATRRRLNATKKRGEGETSFENRGRRLSRKRSQITHRFVREAREARRGISIFLSLSRPIWPRRRSSNRRTFCARCLNAHFEARHGYNVVLRARSRVNHGPHASSRPIWTSPSPARSVMLIARSTEQARDPEMVL